MFIWILCSIIFYFMYLGFIPFVYLHLICALIIIFGIVSKKAYSSGNILDIDYISRKSKINNIDARLKLIVSILLISACIVFDNKTVSLSVFVFSTFFIVVYGGLNIFKYLKYISVPAIFIFLGAVAILFEISKVPSGTSFDAGLFYINIVRTSQLKAQSLIFRSFAAVSALYLTSLTTMVSQFIRALKYMHIPPVIADLSYLIYRCIFIILIMHNTMKSASESRLGYRSYSAGIKTTAKIYSSLLIRSYKKASRMFDAMESRMYSGEIKFLDGGKYERNLKN